MTDREMLELAAKAAGISGEWARWHQAYGDEWVEGLNCGGRFLWNPLTDDGDALRLAVKLGFINPGNWPNPGGIALENWATTGSADWYTATRRAIVRAAAEIGKAMP